MIWLSYDINVCDPLLLWHVGPDMGWVTYLRSPVAVRLARLGPSVKAGGAKVWSTAGYLTLQHCKEHRACERLCHQNIRDDENGQTVLLSSELILDFQCCWSQIIGCDDLVKICRSSYETKVWSHRVENKTIMVWGQHLWDEAMKPFLNWMQISSV